ncbi:MAG TPA: response regulator transcription factor [Acidimicrobiales bacterium]|nr:response regulator transcription factor [Acidimicrobiales bacterium]
MTRLLVVDDDDQIRSLLRRVLAVEGYEVDLAATATAAARLLADAPPDLVLLDVNLPDDDGRDLLAKIRQTSDVPVVLLTGLGEEADRILGLKLGADDYVVKPFSPGELVARIQNILRRAGSPPRDTSAATSLTFDDLTIDLRSREVRVQGEVVEMTAKEFDLLAFLASSPRQVFSRAQLLDQVWGSSPDWQDDATVTEHVRRLRRRIEVAPLEPKRIVTVRGAGYRFEP